MPRDHTADRRRFAQQTAAERGVRAFLKSGARVPPDGWIQRASLEAAADLKVGDDVAEIEDHGDGEGPSVTIFAVAELESRTLMLRKVG